MEIVVSDIDPWVLSTIGIWTILISIFTIKKLNDVRLKIMFTLLSTSIFVYSGYGISFTEVDNRFIIKYIVFSLFFSLPFIINGAKIGHETNIQSTKLDKYFESHIFFLQICTFFYLVCLFIPLVYPVFKLFQIFETGFNGLIGFYDLRVQYNSNALIGIIDTLKVFICPFFFIYLTVIKEKRKSTNLPIVLFSISLLFDYMRYSYMGRYQMVINAMLIFIVLFSAKGYKYEIKLRQIVYIIAALIASVPFLYAFTFIRQGNSVDSGVSFGEVAKLLINSEAYYPIYYDHILTTPYLRSQTPLTFILWLIFLPIPSALWPGKPTLQSDAFTSSISGMHYGDEGYSSFLPSVMGESFMYFGESFYWVQAVVMGTIMIYLIKYLFKNRSTNLLSFYLIVYVLAVGRGGAASYMSTILFGVLPIYLFEKIIVKTKTKKKI